MIKSALQSSLTNDIKHRSMSAGAVPSSEYLITTTVLDQATPSVTFDVSGLSGTYKHLQIVWTSARVGSADVGNLLMSFNGDTTTTNYWNHGLQGAGSTPFRYAQNSRRFTTVGGAGSEYTAGVTDILDPFTSTKKTVTRTLAGRKNGESFIHVRSLVWNNNASISSIQIAGEGFNLEINSRFSLYGVTA